MLGLFFKLKTAKELEHITHTNSKLKHIMIMFLLFYLFRQNEFINFSMKKKLQIFFSFIIILMGYLVFSQLVAFNFN